MVGVDFMPEDDSGQYQINLKAPDGTSYPQMDAFMKQVEGELKQMPFIDKLFMGIGVSADSIVNTGSSTNRGYFIVELEDLKKRGKGYSIFEYIDATRNILAKYDDVKSQSLKKQDW